ncbi:MAG: flagellar filament protein FlaA [Treponema sp.]|nr:flagellar filament protein FlaA [Candidatus Treponema caballi]
MKQSGVICVIALLLLMFSVPVFAQPNMKSVETIMIDTFDTKDDMEWNWSVQASKYIHIGEDASDTYPKMGYFQASPNSLKAYRTANDPEPYVLGVQVSYDRKGDNWFEVYPTDKETGKVYEIPLLGTVTQLDVWVWGANYDYYLELLLRDADGNVHVVPACTLNFQGWRNVIIDMPSTVRQQSRLRSGPETSYFIGFRVHADANEYADDFVIYFDQLRYSTNTLNNIYDGYELRKPNFEAQGE